MIQWLPFGGGSLYLARNDQGYQDRNWDGLLTQPPGGTDFEQYIDLLWMYRALSKSGVSDARSTIENVIFPAPETLFPPDPLTFPDGFLDNGNSLAFLYHWLYTAPAFLDHEPIITADHPLAGTHVQFDSNQCAVESAASVSTSSSQAFAAGDESTAIMVAAADDILYWAYNHDEVPITVRYSDGYSLRVAPNSYATSEDPHMEIDIEPRRPKNRIRRSKRFVSVALLGSEDVNVRHVDPRTLAFGPEHAKPAFDLTKPYVARFSFRDIDRDGDTDLITWFRTRETGIGPGDREACLHGRLDSRSFHACDSVRVRRR